MIENGWFIPNMLTKCIVFVEICSKVITRVLANEGPKDWKHIRERLRQHENSVKHMTNMNTWNELRAILDKNQTIDKN